MPEFNPLEYAKSSGVTKDVVGEFKGFFRPPTGPGAASVGIDPETQKLISSKSARAQRPQSEFVGEQIQGTQAAGSFQTPEEQYNRQAAQLGMQSPEGLNEALKRRSARSFSRTMEDLTRQAKAMAPARQSEELNSAYNTQMNVERINAMNHKKSVLADINNRALKNQVISNVFGMIGAAAGTYMGGPMGGKMGQQVGESVITQKDTEEV